MNHVFLLRFRMSYGTPVFFQINHIQMFFKFFGIRRLTKHFLLYKDLRNTFETKVECNFFVLFLPFRIFYGI